MKRFISRILIFGLITFVSMELVSRLALDPLYFFKADTYNNQAAIGLDMYRIEDTKHVDYLFIGSSRVPATIDPLVFEKHEPTKIAIVGGRGKMTGGIHLQAIKNRLEKYPDYLKGAKVFLEYPESGMYTEPYLQYRYLVAEATSVNDRGMPHLIIPHLNSSSLLEFWKYSQNSIRTKTDVVALYSSSAYRNSFFVNEVYHKFDQPLGASNDTLLANEGGIKNEEFEKAQKFAIEMAAINKHRSEVSRPLTKQDLNESILAKLHNIITSNGGELILYKVPLHSVQMAVYNSDKERKNKQVFEEWIKSHGISIIEADEFVCADGDFPDTWHLAKSRRTEFSEKLFKSYQKYSRN